MQEVLQATRTSKTHTDVMHCMYVSEPSNLCITKTSKHTVPGQDTMTTNHTRSRELRNREEAPRQPKPTVEGEVDKRRWRR